MQFPFNPPPFGGPPFQGVQPTIPFFPQPSFPPGPGVPFNPPGPPPLGPGMFPNRNINTPPLPFPPGLLPPPTFMRHLPINPMPSFVPPLLNKPPPIIVPQHPPAPPVLRDEDGPQTPPPPPPPSRPQFVTARPRDPDGTEEDSDSEEIASDNPLALLLAAPEGPGSPAAVPSEPASQPAPAGLLARPASSAPAVPDAAPVSRAPLNAPGAPPVPAPAPAPAPAEPAPPPIDWDARTPEERRAAFRELLEEAGIDPEAAWSESVSRVIFDPRYYALRKTADKLALYKEFCDKKLAGKRAEEEKKLEESRARFATLLDEITIRTDLTMEALAAEHGADERFQSLKEAERERMLDDRIEPLLQAERDERERAMEEKRRAFRELLRETTVLTHTTHHSELDELIGEDTRFRSLEAPERLSVFQAHLRELRARADEERRKSQERAKEERRAREARERERENERRKRLREEEQKEEEAREKERRRRREEVTNARAHHEDVRKRFEECLKDTVLVPWLTLVEATELMSGDERAEDDALTALDKDEIYKAHVKVLYAEAERRFRELLSESKYSIGLHNSWAQARSKVEFRDGFDDVPIEDDRERIYDRWLADMLREALRDMERCVRNNDSIRRHRFDMSLAEARRLLKRERPYKRLKHHKEERDRIIQDFLNPPKRR